MPPVAEEAVGRPVRHHAAGNHRQPAHERDREDEDRDRQPPVRDDLVNLVGERRLVLPRLVLRERLVHHAGDELVALARDDRLGVVVHFLLAVADVLLDVLERADRNLQALDNVAVVLEDLDCVPADDRLRDDPLDRLLDVRERVLDRAGEDVRRLGLLLRRRGERNGLLGGLQAPLALHRGYADDLAAEGLRDLREVDLVAVLLHDVHHVHGHHHRDAELGELRREVEVALDVRAVHDVQDDVGLLLHEVPARDLFLQRIGRERVDAGEVLDDDVLVPLEKAVLLLDRHARPVADVLVRAGERVEERRLARVRVAREGDFDSHG